MTASPISDSDLGAYADRQLATERIAAVEAALARDPALAARIAELRAQSAALRDALDPMLAEPVPEALLDAARPPEARAMPRAQATRWRMALAAAASLVV